MIREIAAILSPLRQMRGEVFRGSLRGVAVVVVRQAARNEAMVEELHLAPLELLALVNLIGPERMGKRHHVSDRAAPVRLGECGFPG